MAIVTDIDAFLRKSLHSPLPVEKEEDIVEAQAQQEIPVEKRVRSKSGYMLRAPGQLDWREGLLPPEGYEFEGEGGPIAPQYERMPTEAEFMEGFEPYVEPGPTKAGPEEYRPEDIQEAGEESGISGTFEPDTGDFDTGEPDTGDFDTGDFDTGEPGGPKDPPQGPGQTNTDIYKQHLPEELHDDPEALAMAARDAAELQYDTEHADDEPDETWDVEIDGDIWTAERFDDKIWYVSAAGEVLRERDTTDSKSPFYDPPPPSRGE